MHDAFHLEGEDSVQVRYTGSMSKAGDSEDIKWMDERCLRR